MPPADLRHTSYSFDAIGTSWRVESADKIALETRNEISDLIGRFDKFWSRFRDDSVVSQIAREPGSYPLPPEATRLFSFYRELYEISNGRITPLVGRALEHWGYDAAYSLAHKPGRPDPIPAFDEALTLRDGVLEVPKPVLLDIGAAGKGLLVDMVTEVLISGGHEECVVDASGDLRRHTHGTAVERVGLENPMNPALAIGVAEIGKESLAGSGTERRRWSVDHHHILDGITGLPTRGMAASFVVAKDAMVADGFATALLVIEPGLLQERSDISFVVMSDNGVVHASPNFRGEVFS